MLDGILTPAFLQAAGRAGKGEEEILVKLASDNADKFGCEISGTGEIRFEFTNDEGIEDSYTITNPEDETIQLQAKSNSTVRIYGAVTSFVTGDDYFGGGKYNNIDFSKSKSITSLQIYCTYITSLILGNKPNLLTLIVSSNNDLSTIDISDCQSLSYLDIQANANSTNLIGLDKCLLLQTLVIANVETINLSNQIELTALSIGDYSASIIYYPATNQTVSQTIADYMTDESSTSDGDLYTDENGAYYSILESAASQADWSIHQISK